MKRNLSLVLCILCLVLCLVVTSCSTGETGNSSTSGGTQSEAYGDAQGSDSSKDSETVDSSDLIVDSDDESTGSSDIPVDSGDESTGSSDVPVDSSDETTDSSKVEDEDKPCIDHKGGEATCTSKAICDICGEEYGVLLAHTEKTIGGKAPTCTEEGLTDGKTCTVCGEIIKEQEVIEATGHTEEAIEGTDATCTENGLTEGKKCTVCGETTKEQEVIEAKGHTEEVVEGKVPTCTENGLTEGKKCTICGETIVEQEVIEATGHTEQIIAGKEPTCKETGLSDGVVCSVCKKTISEQVILPIGDHDYVNGICSVCSKSVVSTGLQYTRSDDGMYAILSGFGDCWDNEIYIPETFNGLPVKEINADVFASRTYLTGIHIPDTVTNIKANSFKGCTSIRVVEMPGVTTVGDNAFYGCSSIEEVEMPSVSSIGKSAFYGCSSIKKLSFPSHIRSIGVDAFSACSGLEEIEFGSINTISTVCFKNCTSLKRITLPSNLSTVKIDAFEGCTSLEGLYISDLIAWLKIDFEIEGSNPLKYAKNLYLNGEAITSLVIPTEITEIKKEAFNGATSITSVFAEHEITVATGAFLNCSEITEIYLPNTTFSAGSLSGCAGLESITMKKYESSTHPLFGAIFGEQEYEGGARTEQYFRIYDSKDYDLERKDCYKVYYIPSSLKNVVLTSGTCLEYGYFYNCSNLQSVTLPSDMESFGRCAFYNCKKLKNFEFPEGLHTIDELAFSQCSSLEIIELPKNLSEMGLCVFASCEGIKEVKINSTSLSVSYADNNVGSLMSYAIFASANLNDLVVYIGEDVTKIPAYFFAYTKIKEINYEGESKINYIGKSAFIQSEIDELRLSKESCTIGESAFTNAIIGTITFPKTCSLGDWAFNTAEITNLYYNAVEMSDRGRNNCTFIDSRIKNLYIGSEVKRLPRYLFYCLRYENNSKIMCGASVSFIAIEKGSSLESVGTLAFNPSYNWYPKVDVGDWERFLNVSFEDVNSNFVRNADKVYSNGEIISGDIVIPEGATKIPSGLFRYSNISSITIPSSVTEIGHTVFTGCLNLKKVVIPETVKTIGTGLFSGCTGITEFAFPSSITSVQSRMFEGCTALAKVTLTENIKSIDSYAFKNCSSLNTIVIPKNVTSIGTEAFINCTKLYHVYNLSDLTLTEGDKGYGYVAYYAKKISTSIDEESIYKQNGDFLFMETDNGTFLMGYLGSDKNVVLPDNYNGKKYGIWERAFAGNTTIESIDISNGVSSIDKLILENCTSLKEIRFNANIDNADSAFASTNGEGVKLIIGKDVTKIPDKLLYGKYYNNSGSGSSGYYKYYVSEVTYEEGCACTSIGKYAFYTSDNLKKLKLPGTITTLGDSVFPESYYNDKLCLIELEAPTSVLRVIPKQNKLQKLYINGGTDFYMYDSLGSSLTTVIIGETITSINGYSSVFYECYNLLEIYNLSSIELTLGSSENEYVAYYAKAIHTSLDEPSIVVNDGDYSFAYMSDDEIYLISYNGEATEIILPSSYNGKAYKIGDYAFYKNTSITKVTVPNGVTAIGENAFADCTSLAEIVLSNGLVSIDRSAFAYCSSIECIELPDSVVSIGEEAFSGCSRLIEVKISPNSKLESIGDSAFSIFIQSDMNSRYQGAPLQSIVIPAGLKTIGYNAFASCEFLYEIYNLSSLNLTIGSSDYGYIAQNAKVIHTSMDEESIYDEIDGYVFVSYDGESYLIMYNGENTELILPENYKGAGYIISDSAFKNNVSIISVVIPDSIKSIDRYAFYGCSSLKTVSIGDGVESIGDSAFGYCTSLESSIGGNGIVSIGRYAFYGCSSLKTLSVGNRITNIGDYAFYNCSLISFYEYNNALYLGNEQNPYTILFKAKSKSITTCDIHESTKIIYDSAFEECQALTSITIPEGIKEIRQRAFYGCSALAEIRYNAISANDCKIRDDGYNYEYPNVFIGTSNGTKVIIGKNVTRIPSLLFSNATYITSVEFEEESACQSIGDSAFYNCKALTSIVIPQNVTAIEKGTFSDCEAMVSVVIPDGVTSIGENAFYRCMALKSITIPENVTSIGRSAFSACVALTEIKYNATEASPLDTYNNYVFAYAGSKGEGIRVVIGKKVTMLPDALFYPYNSSPNIVSVEFEEGSACQSIGRYTFYGCSSLTNITLPDSITSIGYYAFANCSALSSIVISDEVTRIDGYAFSGCSNITIYCEASSKPSGWDSNWNLYNYPVVWGYTEE